MSSTIERDPKRIKSKILKLLSRHPEGLTVTQASKRSGFNYMTVSRYFAILRAEGKVDYVQIGMAKLYRLNPKVRGKSRQWSI